jgi:Zn-finger nucleic acid-binding protein
LKLVACPDCHAQYDVSPIVPDLAFDCRCGSTLKASAPLGADVAVLRCSACGAVAEKHGESCAYCRGTIVRAPSRGSLICPECMARNLDDARFCLACGIGFEPQTILSDEPELRCPCCERWMATREVGGLVVQECPKCFGLWAPDDTLEVLVDRAAAVARERADSGEDSAPRVDGANPAASQVEYRRCPTCDALMNRNNFRKRSGIIIDQCYEHGTWLDANELERIAGFVLSGRAESAARIEAAQSGAREREEARAAARRVQGISSHGGFDSTDWGEDRSIFSSRTQPSVAGTIFDVLSALLR